MEKIIQWLRDRQWKVNVPDYDYIYAEKEVYKIVIVYHGVCDQPFTLNISTKAAFDRWANSSAIRQYFSKDSNLISYLNSWNTTILPVLIEYLSSEYEDLKKTYDEEEEFYRKEKYKSNNKSSDQKYVWVIIERDLEGCADDVIKVCENKEYAEQCVAMLTNDHHQYYDYQVIPMKVEG